MFFLVIIVELVLYILFQVKGIKCWQALIRDNRMDFTFSQFVEIIRDAEKDNIIKTSVKLTEIDLAIQYAIAAEQERRGNKEIVIEIAEIPFLIEKYCGISVSNL